MKKSNNAGFLLTRRETLQRCGTGLGTLALGNVLTDSLADAAASAHFLALAADVRAGVDACAETCTYFGVCGGGSPSNKLSEANGFGPTLPNGPTF